MKKDIGFYKVNGVTYANKFDAVMAAQQTNADVKWNFFDDTLQKVDWTTEPILSLDTLYKMRAQQIRDAYDYIIVFCSGGADSNNVIRTFLNNDIHVDEVIGLAPMSGLKNWKFDPTNISEENTISETKFALLPLLNEISIKNPNIKITINDFFEEITKYNDEYWTYQACGNIVTVLTSHFTDVAKFPHIDKLIQQGKRIGLVYGTDKPIIRVDENGNLLFVLADSGINYLNMPVEREYPNVDRVLFYWTPDLPEIMVKQSHVVAKAIHLPENKHIYNFLQARPNSIATGSFQNFIDDQAQLGLNPITKNDILSKYIQTNNSTLDRSIKFSSKSVYQRTVVPFIYPTTYTVNLFQSSKVDADAGFFTRDQSWLHALHGDSRISEMVISGTKALYNSISPKYLNINGTGFINKYKAYKYGHTSDFAKYKP